MNDYDIKKGHKQNVEGGKLEELVKSIFGNAGKADGGKITTEFGGLAPLTCWINEKGKLAVETKMNPAVADDMAAETIKRYNDFLFAATGFTTKERKQRAMKKAKGG